ncbi:MAG: ATP-binding cassette domain-containing protein [Planctomycetes bacterium]|nr:ATP-binding cassette domain-containing protein [Planctomycetota bacterium]
MLDLDRATVIFQSPGGPAVRALDGVSLQVPAGQFVVVIGTNGSGKSTLQGAIAGTVRLSSGRVLLAGHDISTWSQHARARLIGRVFQDPRAGTAASLSVLENIAVAACRGRLPGLGWATDRRLRDEAAARIGRIVPGLEERLDQPIGSMSGGQRQIVTLLMATWHRPELLLLDEHTAALDPAAADRVVRATADLIRAGKLTALMVTHSLAQAASLGDRLVLVHRGRIELDVEGPAKRRLTPEDLADRFDALRRADQLDDAAARTLADLYG